MKENKRIMNNKCSIYVVLCVLIFSAGISLYLAGCQKSVTNGGNDQIIWGKIISPPNGGVYLGVYNWNGSGVQTFEQAIGRKVAIGNPYSINDGGTENRWPSFDIAGHEKNWQAGYVTWTGIETGLGVFDDPKFIPQDVIDGKIDSFLVKMAEDIRDWGRPIFWMYPREPSIQPAPGYDGGGYGPEGNLTREEAINQGYSDRAEYGDPDELDGPERYRDMCRHIHDVMAPIAPNITWVMGAVVARTEGAYSKFYPGDDYVDWHALDIYAGGEENVPFVDIIEPDWTEALSINPDKPVIIVEFGIGLRGINDRSQWSNDFFQAVKTTHKQLGAFIYWQFPGSGFEIMSGDPCADDWYNELNGIDSAWWHSSIVTENSK